MSGAFAEEALREDRFLDGRLRLLQPAAGYRAATDPVFLAAAVPAMPDQLVLDLGCGAGVATLCLGHRVTGLDLHGLEIQRDYLDLAERNAAANGIGFTGHLGDVASPPKALRALSFDHVMLNPPYHRPGDAASPDRGRDRAHREGKAGLGTWIGTGLTRLKPQGWLSVIHRAERVPELLGLLDGPAGDIALRPLVARHGRAAGRVIVRARKGSRGPFRLLAPLVLHAGDEHLADGDDLTPQATAILRGGAALAMD